MDLLSAFSIGIILVVFIIFLILGYLSQKRSGGFFLLLAGFTLLDLAVSMYPILGLVCMLLIAFTIYILLSGVNKAFLAKTSKPETGVSNQS